MSLASARAHLTKYGLADKIIELPTSSATVELAAAALKVEAARITKTMALSLEDTTILILMAGDVKIDNHKYQQVFHTKAKLVPWDDCEDLVGHPAGGICPFGIKENIDVYLDDSLRRFYSVYPACGTANTAIELTIPQLELCAQSKQWIDVTIAKIKENT